ncbi:MAG: hypothetical protein K2N24_08775 [Lachnospiraceae bacterium]|nr:hypothetical protein [Lachnospiraceae bacterium]
MIRKKIKQAAFGMSLLSVFMITGCLQTPDVEYVANKEGQDTLISDNAIVDNGIPISQQVQAPSRATGICEKVNEYTSIEVDADVIVPSGTTVPVYTVAPMRIDAEVVEACTGTLFETGEFYNLEYDTHTNIPFTVEELNHAIEYCTKALETAEITNVSQPVLDEDGNVIEMDAEYAQMLQEQLAWIYPELERVSALPTYGSPVSYDLGVETSKIVIPQQQVYGVELDMDGETVDYEYEYAAFTGRHNGIEYHLTMFQDELNTELRFERPYQSRLSNGYDLREIDCITEYNGSYMTKKNTCNYSQEEAVALCKDFLAELGIDNMEAQYVTDIYLFKNFEMGNEEEFLGKKGWRIFLYWGTEDMGDCFSPYDRYFSGLWNGNISGCTLREELQDAYNSSNGNENGKLKTWRGMAIFSILDDGILDAWIQNPVENKELLAENVVLLNFDQVLEQGMAHLETLYGDSGSGAYGRRDIKIRVIELNYARMQSPDTEGEFAMIPVWDFKTGPDGECMVSINAIDGSAFDRSQGY